MLLILEEYFKDHPIKRKIVEGLYNRGISVNNGKFYTDGIEISISEVAKTFGVNRRTVYDTIKIIESTPGVKQIMASIRPLPDISQISPLMGDQVVTMLICPGYFSRAMSSLVDAVRKYGSYIKEIYGKNLRREETILRAIFFRTVPRKIFDDLAKIEGIEKIVIDSPGNREGEVVCTSCDVKICPNKLSTGIFEEPIDEM
jgi:hypothetical protein